VGAHAETTPDIAQGVVGLTVTVVVLAVADLWRSRGYTLATLAHVMAWIVCWTFSATASIPVVTAHLVSTFDLTLVVVIALPAFRTLSATSTTDVSSTLLTYAKAGTYKICVARTCHVPPYLKSRQVNLNLLSIRSPAQIEEATKAKRYVRDTR